MIVTTWPRYRKIVSVCGLVLIFGLLKRPAPALPASFDWGSFAARGSTDFGVYDFDNATVLATGDLAQLISTGPNGLIDAPDNNGKPGEDDILLDTQQINNDLPLPPPQQDKGYIPLKTYSFAQETLLEGSTVYIRAWNSDNPATATAYGDSVTQVVEGGVTFNAPRWHTDKTVNTNIVIWVGSVDNNWHIPENWSTGQVPVPGSSVLIPEAGNVQLDEETTVGELTIAAGATLDLGTHKLFVEEVLTNNGVMRQTQTVDGTDIEFFHITNSSGSATKYRGLEISSPEKLGEVTIEIRDKTVNEQCPIEDTNILSYAGRCFVMLNLDVESATVTLWPDDIKSQELNSENLSVYQIVGGNWRSVSIETVDVENPSSEHIEQTPGVNSVTKIPRIVRDGFVFMVIVFVMSLYWFTKRTRNK